jgi:hypothetical protein
MIVGSYKVSPVNTQEFIEHAFKLFAWSTEGILQVIKQTSKYKQSCKHGG